MTSSAKPRVSTDLSATEPSEKAVIEYLKKNPEFFDRNPRLLQSLSLPHESGGTVSLVERQVATLRGNELAHGIEHSHQAA